ncbi:MAG: hypothetical protein QNK04_13670 [Myxococcota bacterium]|nr:hypothetical protein [Myxococcota bacterium]
MPRLSVFVALAAAAGLLLAQAGPLLSGEVRTFNDLGLLHLPVRAFYADCLAQGHDFWWWPNQYTGVYLHGEGQGGLLHPLQWLGYRVLPLAAAFELEQLRSPAIAFAGALLLLLRCGLGGAAASFGALLVGFSGFGYLHYLHPNLVGVWAHVPWLMLCIHVALTGAGAPRALAIAGLVGLTASQLLLGHPQAVWLSLLVEAAWALFTVRSAGLAMRSLGSLAAAKLLALGVAGVQVLATLESLARSDRIRATEAFGATPALAPLDLLQLLAPYLFENRVVAGIPWERGAWPGATSVVLAVWVVMRRRSLGVMRLRLGLFGLALSLLGFWLALGDAGGLYRLQRALPIFEWLRAPARHVAVGQLGLALAAAVAFADLARLGERVAWRRLWPLALPAALAALCAAVLVLAPGGIPLAPAGPLRWAGPLLLGAAAALVTARARGHALALPALVLLAALDLGSYGLGFLDRHPRATPAEFAARLPVPPGGDADRRLAGHWALSMRGVRFAAGYLALPPARALPLAPAGARPDEARGLESSLRLAGVAYARGALVPAPLPRVRLVTRARASDDPAADLAAIDVDRVALVERPLQLDSGEVGEARVTFERPGEIVARASAPGRQLLVLSESHHPGWQARVAGEPCEVLPVYGDYLGCVVGPGAQDVVFRFHPPRMREALGLSATCGVVTVLWCVAIVLRGRQPR